MNFELLLATVRRKEAEFQTELCRATDPYRLKQLLLDHSITTASLHAGAMDLVNELEEIDKDEGI